MPPSYPYNAIPKYVESVLGNKILQVYKNLAEFIEKTSPIIEDVQQRINIIDNIPFGKLKRAIMEDSLRNDLNEAKAALDIYRSIYGKTDIFLGIMTANYGLAQYLKDSNIPANQIELFREELKLYWEATYGLHINHLEKCRNLLADLKKILEAEIQLLEEIPNELYLIAIENNEKLRSLFQEERKTFWLLAETAQITPEETNKLKNILNTQMQRTKTEMLALSNIISKGTQKDIQESKSRLEAAVISLTFIIGAWTVISEIPKNIKKRVLFNLFNRISDEERLSNSGKILLDKAAELLAS